MLHIYLLYIKLQFKRKAIELQLVQCIIKINFVMNENLNITFL